MKKQKRVLFTFSVVIWPRNGIGEIRFLQLESKQCSEHEARRAILDDQLRVGRQVKSIHFTSRLG